MDELPRRPATATARGAARLESSAAGSSPPRCPIFDRATPGNLRTAAGTLLSIDLPVLWLTTTRGSAAAATEGTPRGPFINTAARRRSVAPPEKLSPLGRGRSPLATILQRAGRITRVRCGVYRLVHFPAGEHEELNATWLWSEQAGVVSHRTALALHGLSDALPARIHLTLPSEWRSRRFRVPAGVVLHHADVPADERSWFGAVPVTGPARSLNDCAREAMSPDLLRQAAEQALRRGLVTRAELGAVVDALEPFGGLAA